LWTPRPGIASSEASFTFRCRLAANVPKHIAYRGLIRTGLSLTFQLRFTDTDGILRIAASSSRDLPAVEVALFPLALRIASPKLNAAISPSSRRLSTEAPIQDLPGRIKPAAPCLPTHRSVSTDLPEHRSAPAQMPLGYILLPHAGNTVDLNAALAELPTLLGFVTSKIVWVHNRSCSPGYTINRYQPRTPGAAQPYCRTRANFPIGRRTAFSHMWDG